MGAVDGLGQCGPGVETGGCVLASVSWQSVCILWLCTALLVTYGDWPLGKYVVGEGGLIGVLMPLKTGGSALAPAAHFASPGSFAERLPLLQSPFLPSFWTMAR